MSGYKAAVDWLAQNAPEWRLVWADAQLVAGPTLGAGTEERVAVRLHPTMGGREERYGPSVELSGEGATHLAAVQRAIGAYA